VCAAKYASIRVSSAPQLPIVHRCKAENPVAFRRKRFSCGAIETGERLDFRGLQVVTEKSIDSGTVVAISWMTAVYK
jgi:hypothetical protein